MKEKYLLEIERNNPSHFIEPHSDKFTLEMKDIFHCQRNFQVHQAHVKYLSLDL